MTIICADCGRATDGPHLCQPPTRPLARLIEDDPMAKYDGEAGSLVPGYWDTADGQADVADQRRWDGAR